MNRFWKWTSGILAFLFVTAFIGLSIMAGSPNDAYAAWPERIYIIDESGHIAYRGGIGPFNYKPEEARGWLAARYGTVKHEAPKSAPAASSSPAPSAPAK